DLGQALVVLDDQDAHGGHHSIAPQKTGSGGRGKPARCCTAGGRGGGGGRATTDREWRVDSPPGPSVRPRVNPARSISHAADSFTRPSARDQRGIAASPVRATTAASASPAMIGFVKNEPQLRRLSSWGASTSDFERRM